MAKVERRTLYADTVDLVAKSDKTVSIDLPRDKFIRRIELRQHGNLNLANEVMIGVPSPVPSAIKKIRLIRDGSEVLISADPSYLMAMDYVEHGGAPTSYIPSQHLNEASQKWYSNLSLDFMVNPANPNEVFLYDEGTGQVFTVMLPAMDYSSLKLEIDVDTITATDFSALYDVVPTTEAGLTASLDITLEEVFMEKGDPVITRDNVYELRTVQNELGLLASADAQPYEVTTGVLMRRMALFQDDVSVTALNPSRPLSEVDGSELISRFKLKQTSPISWTMRDEHFGSMQAQDIREYNVGTMERRRDGQINSAADTLTTLEKLDGDVGIMRGFTVMDFDDGRNLVGSLDLTGMKSGDIKLFLKTTATVAAASADKLYIVEHYMI